MGSHKHISNESLYNVCLCVDVCMSEETVRGKSAKNMGIFEKGCKSSLVQCREM